MWPLKGEEGKSPSTCYSVDIIQSTEFWDLALEDFSWVRVKTRVGEAKYTLNMDRKFRRRSKKKNFYLPHLVLKSWKKMVNSCPIFRTLMLGGEWEKRFTGNFESLSRGEAASVLSLSDKCWRLLRAGNIIPPADFAVTGNNINPCLGMAFDDCSLGYLGWLEPHSSLASTAFVQEFPNSASTIFRKERAPRPCGSTELTGGSQEHHKLEGWGQRRGQRSSIPWRDPLGESPGL